jgi:hypothetical protein
VIIELARLGVTGYEVDLGGFVEGATDQALDRFRVVAPG